MRRTITLSVVFGFALSLAFWLSMAFGDVFVQSRLQWRWGLPLFYIQGLGFTVAALLFPCKTEGLDLGCEAYKWAPVFLGINALAYATLMLPVVHYWRRAAERRRTRVSDPHVPS